AFGFRFVEEIGLSIPGRLWYASSTACDTFGVAVDAGDFNGDGTRDLALSVAALDYRPERLASLLFIFFDALALPDLTDLSSLCAAAQPIARAAMLVVIGAHWSVSRGLASLGDVNGDGLDDLLYGSGTMNTDATDLYVVYGRRDPPRRIDLTAIPFDEAGLGASGPGITRIEAPAVQTKGLVFGRQGQFAGVGDLNEDGYAEFLVAETYRGFFFSNEPRH